MSSARERLIERAISCTAGVWKPLAMSATADWIDLDISMAQLKALFSVLHSEPTTVSAIAHLLGTGVSTASHLIDKLVQSELVDRQDDPDNRRRAILHTTAHGRELLQRLVQGREEHMRRIVSQLDDDQLRTLVLASTFMREAAERLNAQLTAAE
jgi:DNA-binding MarR family transcriptional regulator